MIRLFGCQDAHKVSHKYSPTPTILWNLLRFCVWHLIQTEGFGAVGCAAHFSYWPRIPLHPMFIKRNIHLPFDIPVPPQNYTLTVPAFWWGVIKNIKMILHLKRLQGSCIVVAFEIPFAVYHTFLLLLPFENIWLNKNMATVKIFSAWGIRGRTLWIIEWNCWILFCILYKHSATASNVVSKMN